MKTTRLKLSIISLLFFVVFAILIKTNNHYLVSFDTKVIDFFHNRISNSTTTFFKTVTWLGEFYILGVIALIISIIIFIKKDKLLALFFAFAYGASGLVIPMILKLLLKRERPSFMLIDETGYSFPSGHVTGSTVFYGLLIIIISILLANKLKKTIFITLCTIVIVIVAISRVYLGAHYPSDVIGSLFLGLGLINFFYYIYEYILYNQQENKNLNNF